MFKDTSVMLGSVIFVAAGLFGVASGGYEMYKFFAPKYRAVDNQVFKESEQYNDGMVRDLENLQMEYVNGDADKKQALRAIVLHRFSVYPQERMPANLRNFYNQVKSGY